MVFYFNCLSMQLILINMIVSIALPDGIYKII